MLVPDMTGQAQNEDNGIDMQVEPAFGGIVKNGEWLPVWATIQNNGRDQEARLLARITGGSGTTVYAVPVPLPAGARKRVPLYTLPNSFSREMEIQLVSDDELLASETVQVQPQMNNTYVVGILSPERGATSLINGVKLPGQFRPVQLVDLTLDVLPERPEGLRSFDAILINDTDTSELSQDQRNALANWVQAGGRLVIGGGPGAQKTVSGLPEMLIPTSPDQLVELDDVSNLADFANTDDVNTQGPFLAATGPQISGSKLVDQNDVTLVAETEVGGGVVDYIALDITGAPFNGWSGTTPFWETLLSVGAAYPNWLPTDISQRQMIADQMNYALSTLPALDLPSVRGLAVLLLVYVLMVGPVNYIVLRYFKRLQWAWVTIPALTLIFSVGTFLVGFALRGSDIILNKIALVELQQDGNGRAITYFGLFSPAQSSYKVEVPGSGLLSAVTQYYDPWSGLPTTPGEITFVQGEPSVLEGLAVNQWSMQAFQSEGIWDQFGTISADLKVGQEGITGEITNNTGETIQDAYLILGTRFASLGDISPGETMDVLLSLPEETGFRYSGEIGWMLFEDSYSGAIAPPRDLDVKRTMVNSIFQYGGSMVKSSVPSSGGSVLSQQPVFIGWLDSAPPTVKVNNQNVQEQASALVYQTLDYELGAGPQIWLPVGMLPGSLVEYPFEGGNCGPDNSSVWLGRGDAVFAFQIPEKAINIKPETLRLSIRSDGGWAQLPVVQVYDYSVEQWVNLEGVGTGINLIGDADRYVDPAGNLQVKLSTDVNQGGGCLFVELGMQGSRQ